MNKEFIDGPIPAVAVLTSCYIGPHACCGWCCCPQKLEGLEEGIYDKDKEHLYQNILAEAYKNGLMDFTYLIYLIIMNSFQKLMEL